MKEYEGIFVSTCSFYLFYELCYYIANNIEKIEHSFIRSQIAIKMFVSQIKSFIIWIACILYLIGLISDETWISFYKIQIAYDIYNIFISLGKTEIFMERGICNAVKSLFSIILVNLYSGLYPSRLAIYYFVSYPSVSTLFIIRVLKRMNESVKPNIIVKLPTFIRIVILFYFLYIFYLEMNIPLILFSFYSLVINTKTFLYLIKLK